MKITAIVMVNNNFGIGKDGKMLYHLPNEMKHFKNTTSGHTIIMGHNTYNSLYIKPLPNRTNIVITHHKIEGVQCTDSIENAIKITKDNNETEVFIIGGETIYKQALHYINKVCITIVDDNTEADTFFPTIDFTTDEWDLLSTTAYNENNYNYTINTYEKSNNKDIQIR